MFLHPVDLDRVENVLTTADVIFDQSDFATGIGYPAKRMGDVNGDGRSDLVFIRDNPLTDSLRVEAILGRSENLPHLVQRPFVDADPKTVRFDISKSLFASPRGLTAQDVNVNLRR